MIVDMDNTAAARVVTASEAHQQFSELNRSLDDAVGTWMTRVTVCVR